MNSGKFPLPWSSHSVFSPKLTAPSCYILVEVFTPGSSGKLDGCTGSLPKVLEATGAVPETEGTSPRVTWDGLLSSSSLMTNSNKRASIHDKDTAYSGPAGGRGQQWD